MPVTYTKKDDVTRQIVPTPMVSVSKELDKLGDGTIVGARYTIELTGKLLATKGFIGEPGSPDTRNNPSSSLSSNATVADINTYQGALVAKQKALREMFAEEGGKFVVTSWDGSSNEITCYPRLVSIQFPSRDGVSWVNVCDYTISLEADYIDGAWNTNEDEFDWAISSAAETFDFNEQDGEFIFAWNADRTSLDSIGKTFTLSRTVSAVGKKRFDDSTAKPDTPSPLLDDGAGGKGGGEAWQQASGYVLTAYGLGYERTNLADGADAFNYPTNDLPLPLAFLGLPDYYNVYNHKRNVSVDRAGGSYQITEEWVLASGTTTNSVSEDTNVSISTNQDSGLTQVSINGTLKGFNGNKYPTPFTVDPHSVSNYSVVTSHWEDTVRPKVYQMAKTLAGNDYYGILHPKPMTTSVTKNPGQGTIGFDYAFDTRPANCVPGALMEAITVNDSAPGQTIVETPVIGRILGPVMQNMGTQSPTWVRTLTIDITMSGIAPADCGADAIGVWLVDMKPSNRTTPYNTKNALEAIIKGAAPHGKPGVTKAYTVPSPAETWDPKNGKYTYNITWNYEINQSKYY